MDVRFRPGINPIIVKELRSRMRGVRAFAILTAVLLVMAGLTYALYRVVLAASSYSTLLSPQVGQSLFAALALLELLMVCFITPAITAGAISSEREKLTYEMLLTTPLHPASILWGKLISALSYVFLLIFAAIPLASLVFTFGGVAPRDMLKTLIVVVAVAVMLGVVGVFMSAWLGRTARATVLSYLVVLALILGPLLIYIMVGVVRQAEPPRWILIPNPISALFSAMMPTLPNQGAMNFLGGLGMALSGNLGGITGDMGGIPRPLYHYTLPLYALLTLVLYLLATQLVKPARRWRIGWAGMGASLLLFALLGGAVALAFGTTAGRYEQVPGLATPMPAPFFPPPPQRAVAVMIAPPTPTALPIDTPPAQSPVATPAEPSLPATEQAAIYTAVVRQLYTVDHTFQESPDFPVVYLVATTDDSAGDPDTPRLASQILPEAVQGALAAALADLPAQVRWVEEPAEVLGDSGLEKVPDDGVLITLGNIHPQADGTLHVPASLYVAPLAAGGRTYVLEEQDDVWQVTGDTGVRWIR